MPGADEYEQELDSLQPAKMEGEDSDDERINEDDDANLEDDDPLAPDRPADSDAILHNNDALNRRTKRKLDALLLPFLALLFLLNSVDKSNIGNAETAGFTRDAGLDPSDLNVSMGYFFAVFVALQPVGAALGRRYGMGRWVPACMSLWGLCTLLHIWVRRRWQLICLRIAIAMLESGFYPTTVAYLSLFYTRYEFGVRLSVFYGQTAVAGVIGGVLSWAVFSRFENSEDTPQAPAGMKGWQLLFLIEGCMTVVVAALGFFWLPRSADTAWFFTAQEKKWAEQRIRLDYNSASIAAPTRTSARARSSSGAHQDENTHAVTPASPRDPGDEEPREEAHHRLLGGADRSSADRDLARTSSITAHAGLSRDDIMRAVFNYKIWHILACNILSAIPATAFSVFLPLVMKQLAPGVNLRPSESNLLSAPPFAFGAIMLLVFATWSDRRKSRLFPIFCGLALLIVGLSVTVLVPMRSYVLRYMALCVLLSGSFIASPLTVAWLTNNTPEPGKRAVMLGINGLGNLGGVFLTVLFTPEDRRNGFVRPFAITLLCALASLAGYIAFYVLLVRENKKREEIVGQWTEDERRQEERFGDMPLPPTAFERVRHRLGLDSLARKLGLAEGRSGDEKVTFRYGL